jgi:acid stress chaperone HdeB
LVIDSIQAPFGTSCGRDNVGLAPSPANPVPESEPVPVSRRVMRHVTSKRKLYMRTFVALWVSCWLLSGPAARAETIDLTTTTCKQFLEGHKNEIGIILAWLDGYYREEDDPPIFDTDTVEANGKKLSAYCAANPNVGLITATDKLFGK